MSHSTVKDPSLLDALLPIAVLVIMLTFAVMLFGDAGIEGANQLALVMAAALAAVIGVKNGHSWIDIVESINKGITMALTAVVILLSVGSLIGVWVLSGTVPSMIYYGLAILSPDWFYISACIISAIVSLCVGSSWTTAGTIGVGLMGVAITMGLSPAIAAGAIISGGYFGDKMSPLSDTTNLAPSVAGSELFNHIRHLTWTTVPSFVIALIFFMFVGSATNESNLEELAAVREIIDAQFSVGWHLLLPLPVLLFLISRKLPALPSIWGGIFVGAVIALIFQGDNTRAVVADDGLGSFMALFKGLWVVAIDGYVANTGNAAVDDLLTNGGMASMLYTIWLIVCAMAFGGIMDRTGLLHEIVRRILMLAKGTASLITSVVCSSFGANLITSDQYIAIVVPGRMFRSAFEDRKLAPVNLSRALEDGGTVTSPLVPWNSCGAFMAATLGVATLDYLPFTIFCLANPIIAIVYAQLNFKVVPAEEVARTEAEPASA